MVWQKSRLLLGCLWAFTIVLTFMVAQESVTRTKGSLYVLETRGKELEYHKNDTVSKLKDVQQRDRNMSLIFVGGMPRSGTTLMRTMLDAHPDIRCGQETRVIPDILDVRTRWLGTPIDKKRLEEAGVFPYALDEAMAQFIMEIIIHHGKKTNIYCDKDPYNLKHLSYLHTLFPNAKFILMIRDGRATAHSVVSRGVTIAGMDITSYRDVLSKWNNRIVGMYQQCLAEGPEICLMVQYEQLVLQPVFNTHRIFDFLEIPWCEAVLHHEKYMNETALSNTERSTDQVKKPLYLDALTSWFGKIPYDVERDMAMIAPMLKVFGYDPYDRTPKYGQPDDFVLSKIAKEAKAK